MVFDFRENTEEELEEELEEKLEEERFQEFERCNENGINIFVSYLLIILWSIAMIIIGFVLGYKKAYSNIDKYYDISKTNIKIEKIVKNEEKTNDLHKSNKTYRY